MLRALLSRDAVEKLLPPRFPCTSQTPRPPRGHQTHFFFNWVNGGVISSSLIFPFVFSFRFSPFQIIAVTIPSRCHPGYKAGVCPTPSSPIFPPPPHLQPPTPPFSPPANSQAHQHSRPSYAEKCSRGSTPREPH